MCWCILALYVTSFILEADDKLTLLAADCSAVNGEVVSFSCSKEVCEEAPPDRRAQPRCT